MSIFRFLLCAALALIALAPFAARADENSIDPGFGWRRTWSGTGTLDERIVAAARAPDGGYVLAGSRVGGAGFYIFLAKFRPDNTYDTSFGDGGRELKDANFTAVTGMTIDAQGRILVVGTTLGALGQSDFGVARFNPDGSEDTSFAGDGSTYIGFDLDFANNRTEDIPQSVTTTPDGSVYVVGTVQAVTSGGIATTRVGVAKLMPDGSNTNTGYGTLPYGRQVFCEGGFCDHVEYLARILYDAPRNRIVLGGNYATNANDTDWFIITQNLNTQTDVLSVYTIDQGGNTNYRRDDMYSLAVQSDGKVVALGISWSSPSNYVPVLLRTNLGGGRDNSFGNVPGGLMLPGTARAAYFDLAIDSSGRLVLAGLYGLDRSACVTRLLPSGAIDSSFNGGFLPTFFYAPTFGGSNAYATRFTHAFLDAGRPILAGEATYSSTAYSDYDLIITRLQSDRIFANGFQ